MSYLELAKQASADIDNYRAALWKWWTLTAAGADVDEAQVQATYLEIMRLLDELGPTTASRLRHTWEIEWFKETGRCPRCGAEGDRHR